MSWKFLQKPSTSAQTISPSIGGVFSPETIRPFPKAPPRKSLQFILIHKRRKRAERRKIETDKLRSNWMKEKLKE